MTFHLRRLAPVFAAGLCSVCAPSHKPPTQRSTGLLKSPVGKDWVTNGGNLTNERYSTLKQIDTIMSAAQRRLDDPP